MLKPKPLRVHTGPALEPNLLAAPIPIQVPNELAEVTPTASGANITFKDYLYLGGKFYPIEKIKELKK